MPYDVNKDSGFAPMKAWVQLPTSAFIAIPQGAATDEASARSYALLSYQVNSPPVTISGDVIVDAVGLDDTGTVKVSGDQLKVFDGAAVAALNNMYLSGGIHSTLYDKDGHPIISREFNNEHFLSTTNLQTVRTSTVNSTTGNLAPGASFTGDPDDTFGVAGIQINLKSDRTLKISVQQSNDMSNWDIVDEWVNYANDGDGRTIQAVSQWVRVVLTNVAGITTTYLNLMTVFCPVVEAVPRNLTPAGKLKLSTSTTSFSPDPANFFNRADGGRALGMDVERNLMVRGQVLTDEKSFRDDFTKGAIYSLATGTAFFRNGEKYVTGLGTSFLDEITKGQYVKLDTDDDAYYTTITNIASDTLIELESNYLGSTASGSVVYSDWRAYEGTSATYEVTGSELILHGGTLSGDRVTMVYDGDYLPYTLQFRAKASQRIADQNLIIGFLDDDTPGQSNAQAYLKLTGTDNAKVRFTTSTAKETLEETEIIIPCEYGETTTDDWNDYKIDVTITYAALSINGKRVVKHVNHTPGPYAKMNVYAVIHNNTGTNPASDTVLRIDSLAFINHNMIDVFLNTGALPIDVKEVVAYRPTVTPIDAASIDTVLLAPNILRLGATIYNDSTSILYVKFGTGASASSYTVQLPAQAYYEVPFKYIGHINGYWVSATGHALVTELV